MGLPELTADTIVTDGRIIPVDSLLQAEVLPGKITGIIAILSDARDKDLFYQLLNRTLKLLPLETKLMVGVTPRKQIRESDQNFLTEFGYTVINLGVARLRGRLVDTWIGPTLIHHNHPMYQVRNRQSVYLACDPALKQGERDGISLIVTSKEQVVSAHYFRTTALDKPSVLGAICNQLGKRGINICEIRQPETKEGNGLAEIAFLLDPCGERRFQLAMRTIRSLDVVHSVSSVFKVIGNPTRDISRPYSSQT